MVEVTPLTTNKNKTMKVTKNALKEHVETKVIEEEDKSVIFKLHFFQLQSSIKFSI